MHRTVKHNRKLTVLGRGEIMLQGFAIKYDLKQSTRIRGIRLEIRVETGLTVVVPAKFTRQQVQDILNEKARWILRHLRGGKPVQMPLFRKEVGHGDRIPYMGKSIEVVIAQDGQKNRHIEFNGDRLIIPMPGKGSSIDYVLEKWYRGQARLVFTQKADLHKEKMGLRYHLIMIRGQRTRWGSCSPSGNITLNWKLMLAPEIIIDYVIIHELAHLRHMNHSQKFWQFVERYCPRWKEYRKWLSKHEDELKSSAVFG
jgi:predicted metal-dependent hydrolase